MTRAKWVLAGGTGFIGQALTKELTADGAYVTILTRTPRGAGRAGDGPAYLAWDPAAPGAWQEAVAAADVVVNLAGAGVFDGRWTEARKREIRASRLAATTALAETMARGRRGEGRGPAFVSSSAVGYYGMHDGSEPAFGEDSPPGTDFLASVCVDWENATRAARDAGVRTAIARIGIVLGAGGGALGTMLPPFKAFVGGPIGSGEQVLSFLHLADAVGALLHLGKTDTVEGPYNLVGPRPVTMKEFAKALGTALHRPSVMKVPAFALRAALGEQAEVILTGQRASASKLLGSGYAFRFPEVSAALRDLVG